jgi:hypothetical protein
MIGGTADLTKNPPTIDGVGLSSLVNAFRGQRRTPETTPEPTEGQVVETIPSSEQSTKLLAGADSANRLRLRSDA